MKWEGKRKRKEEKEEIRKMGKGKEGKEERGEGKEERGRGKEKGEGLMKRMVKGEEIGEGEGGRWYEEVRKAREKVNK